MLKYVSNNSITQCVYFVLQLKNIDSALQHCIRQICNCTDFTVNATFQHCIDDNKALYAVQLTGPMVDNILHLWSIKNYQGIDKGMTNISLCNESSLILSFEQGMSKSHHILAPLCLIAVIAIASVMLIG